MSSAHYFELSHPFADGTEHSESSLSRGKRVEIEQTGQKGTVRPHIDETFEEAVEEMMRQRPPMKNLAYGYVGTAKDNSSFFEFKRVKMVTKIGRMIQPKDWKRPLKMATLPPHQSGQSTITRFMNSQVEHKVIEDNYYRELKTHRAILDKINETVVHPAKAVQDAIFRYNGLMGFLPESINGAPTFVREKIHRPDFAVLGTLHMGAVSRFTHYPEGMSKVIDEILKIVVNNECEEVKMSDEVCHALAFGHLSYLGAVIYNGGTAPDVPVPEFVPKQDAAKIAIIQDTVRIGRYVPDPYFVAIPRAGVIHARNLCTEIVQYPLTCTLDTVSLADLGLSLSDKSDSSDDEGESDSSDSSGKRGREESDSDGSDGSEQPAKKSRTVRTVRTDSKKRGLEGGEEQPAKKSRTVPIVRTDSKKRGLTGKAERKGSKKRRTQE